MRIIITTVSTFSGDWSTSGEFMDYFMIIRVTWGGNRYRLYTQNGGRQPTRIPVCIYHVQWRINDSDGNGNTVLSEWSVPR